MIEILIVLFPGLAYNKDYDFVSVVNTRRDELRPLARDITEKILASLVDLVFIKSARAPPTCPKLIAEFPNLLIPRNVRIQEDLMIASGKSNSFCGVLFDGLQMHDWRVTTPTPGYENRYIDSL